MKTVLYFSYSTTRCEQCYYRTGYAYDKEPEAISALDKTVKC